MQGERELIYESRQTRHHRFGERATLVESRFHTGDATITLAELAREWPNWSPWERIDFCQSFCNGGREPERADILRHIVAHGDHDSWTAIALSVAMELPLDESLPALRAWCDTCAVGRGSGYYQAIARTNDPEAHDVLKRCLARTWQTAGLLEVSDGEGGTNWVAWDAVWCLKELLALGEPPARFRDEYAALRGHPCKHVRDNARRWLGRYFVPA